MYDTRTKRILLALLLVVGLVAAACGRDEEPSGDGGDGTTDTTGADGEEAAGPATTDACESYDGTAGITDDTIKIGTSLPQSGIAASVFGDIATGYDLYIDQLNAEGGIGGRQIELVARDDEYKPEETLANYEKLVAEDGVFALFNVIGTPNNLAIRDDQNLQCVPNLFLGTGSQLWGNPAEYPWTIGSIPTYPTEMAVLVDYLEETNPEAKIAILYQNDDFGKDYVIGLKDALGDKAKTMIVAEAPYEVSDPTVDSQMVKLKASGADLFFNVTTPKFAAQSIKKAAEMGWKPVHLLNINATAVGQVMIPAGPENSRGTISVNYGKDPLDKQWDNDPGMKRYKAFMAKYAPELDVNSGLSAYGYSTAELMVHVLKQAGDELTRANVMKQATNIKGFTGDLALPGMKITTAPDDYRVNKQFQLMKFNGERWERFGELLTDTFKKATN